MMHTIQRLVARMLRPRTVAEKYQRRHEAWDRDCRARGMSAREQADELQIRCAWVRLRRKASAAAMRRPSRYLENLDRIARDEARTLTVIGGEELARVFLRAFGTTNPLDILSPEAASLVLARSRNHSASMRPAPAALGDPAPKRENDEAKQLMRRAEQKASKRAKPVADDRVCEVAGVGHADS